MEYVAIDFETANRYQDSACALGLCLFDEDGRRKDSWYSLIRPRIPYFDPFCTRVHQLDPNDILSAPTLPELWSDIVDFIGQRPLVAHNARFDMGVLRTSSYCCRLEIPQYEYYCTLALARKLVPGYFSYKLTYLVQELLQMEYHAHLASDDAYVCGKLFHRLVGSHLVDKEELDEFLLEKRLDYPRRVG